jgi:hypothetical protein
LCTAVRVPPIVADVGIKSQDYFVKSADVVGVVVACDGEIEFADSEGCQVGVDDIVSFGGICSVNQNFEGVGSDKASVALINI